MALIDNILRYFKCDENAANTIVVDATGTTNGIASVNTNNLFDATGKINSSFDYLQFENFSLNSHPLSGKNTFTYAAWIYVKSFSTTGTIYKNWATSKTVLLRFSSGNLQFYTFAGSQVGGTISTGFSINTWYHIAVTYDGTTMKAYINGVLSGTTFSQSGNLTTTTDIASIGTDFIGRIDEVYLSDADEGQTGINELYGNGSPPAYPFSAITTRLIKIAGTFQTKPILTKVAGTFVDKPIKIKVGGTFQ